MGRVDLRAGKKGGSVGLAAARAMAQADGSDLSRNLVPDGPAKTATLIHLNLLRTPARAARGPGARGSRHRPRRPAPRSPAPIACRPTAESGPRRSPGR